MPSSPPRLWPQALSAAWPLVSRSAFDVALCTVSDEDDRKVRRDLVEALRPIGRGLSQDTLELLAKRSWLQGRDLFCHLVSLANDLLEIDGHCVRIRSDGDNEFCQTIERWRWLSMCLPADLLACARAFEHPGVETDSVDLLTPNLTRVLERGVALTHVHYSAARRFAPVWDALLALPTPPAGDAGAESPFGDMEKGRTVLFRAAIARLVLAHHLAAAPGRRGRESEGPSCLGRGLLNSGDPDANLAALLAQLRGFCAQPCPGGSARAYDLMMTLITAINRDWGSEGDGDDGSQVRALFGLNNIGVDAETLLLRSAFAHFKRGKVNPGFSRLFWQYVRARCIWFRWLVEDPGTSGLSWFSLHFERIWKLGVDDPKSEKAAIDLERRGIGLDAIELRCGFSGTGERVKRLAKCALEVRAREGVVPETGFVLHFVKSNAKEAPNENSIKLRFGDWYDERHTECAALDDLFRDVPLALVMLRGVDTAGLELKVPTWMCVDLMDRVRQSSRRAAEHLFRSRGLRVPPMRATAHAGEDFRSLVEGMRRVHEIVCFGRFHAGDRLGHAIALGVDPVAWVGAQPFSVQTREERIWDLVWELSLYADGKLQDREVRTPRVAGELRAHLKKAEWQLTLEELIEFRGCLHGPGFLDKIGYPHVRTVTKQKEKWLGYFSDFNLCCRLAEPVEIEWRADDVVFMQLVQRCVRQLVCRREITVETNPSSNLIIGDFGNLEAHPAFSLHPVHPHQYPDSVPVSVSINDDDPLTFATRLADEYAYVYGALLRSHVGAEDAMAWLCRARDAGYRSRFTTPLSQNRAILEELARGPLGVG